INAACRTMIVALRDVFVAHDIDLPIYWGNRNGEPSLDQTLARMADDGVRRAVAFVTSAYSSYSGCRQYRENLADAVAPLGARAPRLDKLRHYFNHPGFLEPLVDNVLAALDRLPVHVRGGARLAFTTHSIPLTQAEASGPAGGAYIAQHQEAARLVADEVARRTGVVHAWALVFQSRSGPPTQAWLEPDIGDHLAMLAADGCPGVVMVPIGFVSDHIEVRYDLDVEATERAAMLGLPVARAGTAGSDPRFIAMIRGLVQERAAVQRGRTVDRVALGRLGPSHDACPAGCCPNPRGPRPTCCQAE
ncbi:MAG: ferrochelatase, partial [Actinomycetes bacterium]